MPRSIRTKKVCIVNPEDALAYSRKALETANKLPETDPVLLALDRMLREGEIEIRVVNGKEVYRPVRRERE